jgi:hypothetical protein
MNSKKKICAGTDDPEHFMTLKDENCKQRIKFFREKFKNLWLASVHINQTAFEQ